MDASYAHVKPFVMSRDSRRHPETCPSRFKVLFSAHGLLLPTLGTNNANLLLSGTHIASFLASVLGSFRSKAMP